MPFSFIPLWNTLNEHDMGKHDLCQKLGISSSTMAKMTNGQNVSLDVIARICDYFDCGLESVVQYHSKLNLFAQRIRKRVVECSYAVYTDSFPEYRILLSDRQIQQLQMIEDIRIIEKMNEFEHLAITEHAGKSPVLGTTTYAVQSCRNLLVLKGSVVVVDMFLEWLLEQIDE